MWRAPLAVLLSAISGSIVATFIYSCWLSIWRDGTIPHTAEDVRMFLIFSLATLMFTIPGAILLWALDIVLAVNLKSGRSIDLAVLTLGAIVGAAMLGFVSGFYGDFALLGGFYGATTAALFVLFRRHLGFRRERPF